MSEHDEIKNTFMEIRKAISEGDIHRSRAGIEPKTLTDKLKYELCRSLVLWSEENKWKNKEIAVFLKMTEPQVSRMLSYHINYFSVEFLIEKNEMISFKERKRKKVA